MHNRNGNEQKDVAELLKDLMIIQLARAGAQQAEIRKLLGCGIDRVSRIAKVIRRAKLAPDE